MAGEQDQGGVDTQAWADKTDFLIGADLSAPPPEMRYQLLAGRVYTLQRFPSGSVARGEISLPEFEAFTGKELGADGWYDPWGEFLGDEPGFSQG